MGKSDGGTKSAKYFCIERGQVCLEAQRSFTLGVGVELGHADRCTRGPT